MASIAAYKTALLMLLMVAGGTAYYYQGQTTGLNNRVVSLTSDSNSQGNQINSLKSQIDNLTQQIAQLQSVDSQLVNQIVQLRSQIGNLTQNQGLCNSGKTVTIGELLDLSSELSAQGTRAKDSSALAIIDVNSFLSSAGCNLKFGVSIDDYSLNNQVALTDMQSFAALGVQVVIGPLNSGTAQYILGFTNSHHIVLISPSSTNPVLAIPDDYLFRTSPNDAAQGFVDARMMVDRGASAVIIVQRHDAYGDGVAGATATRFTALGGHVIDTIQYDTSTLDFTPVLTTLQSDFNNNVGTYGANKIAIDVIAFEEFGSLIIQAHNNFPSFPWSTLPWFGTDGEARDSVIVNPTTWGPYVAQVRLPSTSYAPPNNRKTLALISRFESTYPGNICDSYCLGAYDDVWLAALATLQAGSYNGTAIQAIFRTVASNYFGVTGSMELEPSGDRVATSYQIWKVVNQGTPAAPTWVLAGTWDYLTDSITWTSPP